MRITIYELLGMVKDGKAPKKIKYDNMIWKFGGDFYRNEKEFILEQYCNLFTSLNDIVEILEEEKKIPEKISINDNGTIGFPNGEWTARNMDKAFAMKINSIIDYLKSKGE